MVRLINSKNGYILIIVLIVATFMSSCKKDELTKPKSTKLLVSITKHPEGGMNVNSVSINFEGSISGNVKPINATVEWWWENGDHSKQELQNSTEYIFNSENSTSKSTVWSAGSGYILLNYYWVKIKWTDDEGSHVIESSKAFCTK